MSWAMAKASPSGARRTSLNVRGAFVHILWVTVVSGLANWGWPQWVTIRSMMKNSPKATRNHPNARRITGPCTW